MNIEFKEGVVCFADGEFHYAEKYKGLVKNATGYRSKMSDIVSLDDFQLNTIKQGDHISKSELDPEDKYNLAVEVFGLFGFECQANYSMLKSYGNLYIHNEREVHSCTDDSEFAKRKLTLNQLDAIGELKRLMNERESNYSDKSNSSVSKVNRGIDRNKQSATLTTEEETELKSRAMASELDRQDEEWLKGGGKVEHKGRAYYYVCKSPFDGEAVLTPIDVDGWDVISVPYSELQKPKTPEDLLIEELQAKLIDNNAVDTWMLAANIVNGDIEGLSYESSEVIK